MPYMDPDAMVAWHRAPLKSGLTEVAVQDFSVTAQGPLRDPPGCCPVKDGYKNMIRQLLITIAAFSISANGWALTFVVNSTLDTGDTNPGDNVCEATSGGTQCTLRAAIEESNANGSADVIEFSLGLVVINISGSPLPTITGHLRIDGRSAPGYNAGGSDVLDAPPSVYIDGSALSGTTADGFRAFTNQTHLFQVHALGIIGFPDNGIEFNGGNNCFIDRNWIGTGRSGAIAANGGAGVYLNGTTNCLLGREIHPSDRGIGNLISNNAEDGVYLIIGEENLVAGNFIGIDPGGTSLHGNGGHGVFVLGPNNEIGQLNADQTVGNEIAHNAGNGIRVQAGGQVIYGNFVYENGAQGVVINGSGSRLGTTNEASRNFIFDNGNHGVVIGSDFASSDNWVRNNWIFSHPARGVLVSNGGNNLITTNEIWANTGDGVYIDSADNMVVSNDIGFLSGSLVGNGANGVVVDAADTTVQNNDIGGLADDGIDVVSGNGSQITGNRIGTGVAGEDYGNVNVGIRVRAAVTNLQITDNFIGHNLYGIQLDGGGTRVCGNNIGLGALFEAAGNAEGIVAFGGGSVIGDLASGCGRNFIGYNASDGIEIRSAGNVIRDNMIGGELLGDEFTFFGNGAGGILLWDGASLNSIAGNHLVDNGSAGVRVGAPAGLRNRIEQNAFRGNGRTAIDLLDDNVTPNDPGDVDSGPNNVQNTPDLYVLLNFTSTVRITYAVDSDLDRAVYPLNVDFYYSAENFRQGEFLVRDLYDVAPNTPVEIEFAVPDDNGWITAMVVDADGNSSELSFPVAFELSDSFFSSGFESSP